MSKAIYSLVIDHGNTSIKLAFFDRQKNLIERKVFNSGDFNGLKKVLVKTKAKAAIYASTSKPNPGIIKAIKSFDFSLNFNQKVPFPLKVDYKTPKTLGIDRIANAFGAHQIYPDSNVLVIDVGTCITYDFINNEGVYQGGAISPGPKLRAKAMNDYTAKLPLIDSYSPTEVIGKTTKDSLSSGIFCGILFEMDGYVDALNNQIDQLTIILTGGYTTLFANHVKNTIFADSNFTLKGLNEILLHHVEK